VGGRLATATPIEHDVQVHPALAVGGRRLACHHRLVVESDLAEAKLRHHAAPVAAGRQADVLGRHTIQIDDRVGRIGRVRGGAGELIVTQRRPLNAIDRVLDGDLLEPEAQNQFELHVVVPDPHLMELVDLGELILDPDRLPAVAGIGQPHIGRFDGVLIGSIHAGAVDRVLRPRRRLRAGGGGNDILDRINIRLYRERPDSPFDDRGVRSAVDLIDAPIIGLLVIEQAGGIERSVALALADQHAHRIGPRGRVNVLQNRPEVHVVRSGRLGRRPAQHCIAGNVSGVVLRIRVAGNPRDHLPDHYVVDVKASLCAGGGVTGDQHAFNRHEVGIGERADHRAVQGNGDLRAVLLQHHVVVLPRHRGRAADLDPARPFATDRIGMVERAADPAVDLEVGAAVGAGNVNVHVETVIPEEIERDFVLPHDGPGDAAPHPVGGLRPGDEDLVVHNLDCDGPIGLRRPAIANVAVGPVEIILETRSPRAAQQERADQHTDTYHLPHRVSPSQNWNVMSATTRESGIR